MNGQIDLGAISPARYFFGIACVLGLLFGLITVEADSAKQFLQHLFMWQYQALAPMALLVISHLILQRQGWFEGFNPWLKLFVSGVLGSLLFTPLAILIDVIFDPEDVTTPWWLGWLTEFAEFAPSVVITWVAINSPWLLGYRYEKFEQAVSPGTVALVAEQPDTSQEKPDDSRAVENLTTDVTVFSLLPDELGTEVIFMKSELHYLAVTTDQGKALILHNLKDAIADMPESVGFQCHRSYWVNLSFVTKSTRKGREAIISMSSGDEVPVSRSNVSKLKKLLAQNDLNLLV